MRQNTRKAASTILLSMLFAAHGDSGSASGSNEPTATPIKHLVVIYGENQSFDHYFGTYPHALNPKGEPIFRASPLTPEVNGFTYALLHINPNLNPANGKGAGNPFRLDRSQALTSDQNHDYGPEQQAFDKGKMDLFPEYTGTAGTGGTGQFETTGLVLGYYDGNTVTALWNYAQHFALNDNSFGSQFGPSTVGALNLASGQTNGANYYDPTGKKIGADNDAVVDDGQGGLTVIGDPDPYLDACATTTGDTAEKLGQNIGDLLNKKGVTWGWFQGGFNLSLKNSNGTTGCSRSSTSAVLNNVLQKDYVPHHEPFQYYPSTRNPKHTNPSSVAAVGTSHDGGANHQYDLDYFSAALDANNLPAVSFLKARKYQNAHPANSDPLDEQTFLVTVINALQESNYWESTAVILAYDDSDGWYDHVQHVIKPSTSAEDFFLGPNECGPLNSHEKLTPGTPPSNALPGINGKPVNGRCGYGPRLPLLVISPYANHNFVDHTLTDQSSIIKFIEDNWLNGERIGQGSYDAIAGSLENMFDFHQKPTTKLILDPNTGNPVN